MDWMIPGLSAIVFLQQTGALLSGTARSCLGTREFVVFAFTGPFGGLVGIAVGIALTS